MLALDSTKSTICIGGSGLPHGRRLKYPGAAGHLPLLPHLGALPLPSFDELVVTLLLLYSSTVVPLLALSSILYSSICTAFIHIFAAHDVLIDTSHRRRRPRSTNPPTSHPCEKSAARPCSLSTGSAAHSFAVLTISPGHLRSLAFITTSLISLSVTAALFSFDFFQSLGFQHRINDRTFQAASRCSDWPIRNAR